ncbi:MAG: RluA family pseudouridine synthase, partial [Lentisphaerae bacterium]|nr:RluA family pseudouridine synthase [Lentisphaerota bacterium]
MTQEFNLKVAPAEAGQRLDLWLRQRLPELSRSRIQSLIRSGHITLGGSPIRGHRATRAGESVRVRLPPPVASSLEAQPIPLAIIYEDAAIIVVNKPPGMVVHPAPGHSSGTLVNALLFHCPELAGIGGERRPGIVHRLDKDTSGLLVVARHDQALAGLAAQFKKRQVEKYYLALVWGQPQPASGTIETLIGRHQRDRKRMSARPRVGRPALTHYETLEHFQGVSLLRIKLCTGRTHQIRVHMAHLGHPVVGDQQYGRRGQPPWPWVPRRQMLHAAQLLLCHPTTGQRLDFTAPPPPDLASLLQASRGSAIIPR